MRQLRNIKLDSNRTTARKHALQARYHFCIIYAETHEEKRK